MRTKPTTQTKIRGTCLCGGVRFSISGPLRDIVVCHCGQCHQWHGQAAWYTQAETDDIHFESRASLKWHRSSDSARRGFCADCGSSLFWSPDDSSRWSITAGSLDKSTELKVCAHIFCENKPFFDEINDNYPQFSGSSKGLFDNCP